MNKINELNPNLFQTSLNEIDFNRLQITVRQNKFIAGDIYREQSVFINVPRSSKNLFRILDNGLGISSEILFTILPFFSIVTIRIPFEGRTLTTTVNKWQKVGIVSPYSSTQIDKQIILSLNKINMSDLPQHKEKQPSLFETLEV